MLLLLVGSLGAIKNHFHFFFNFKNYTFHEDGEEEVGEEEWMGKSVWSCWWTLLLWVEFQKALSYDDTTCSPCWYTPIMKRRIVIMMTSSSGNRLYPETGVSIVGYQFFKNESARVFDYAVGFIDIRKSIKLLWHWMQPCALLDLSYMVTTQHWRGACMFHPPGGLWVMQLFQIFQKNSSSVGSFLYVISVRRLWANQSCP